MRVFLTGAAGFVGYHVAAQLLSQGHEVIGFDSLNAYYSVQLKQDRLAQLAGQDGFAFHQGDLSCREDVEAVLAAHPGITHIVHLAAQAGVRYSLADPCAYVTSNMMGHVVLLEAARHLPDLRHIVYASSSSVYGLNETMPFRESDAVDRPGSFYAVTKRAGELTAHAYAHLYGLKQTGLRFFTAYGPWGRPDMAYYKFARAITAGEPLTLYEGEGLARDFTYIDDIVSGVLAALDNEPEEGVSRLFNLGSDSPTAVSRLVALLEQELGRKAVIKAKRRPLSDVEATWSSHEEMTKLTGWRPVVSLEEGVKHFVAWFKTYEAANSI
ncbi:MULTISPECIES: NAD-dependent epimerase/dehydratase family protein [Asaia]|uniref:UDP-N-acetylglucosamine 4-epimerase n=1 Tax=Asaia bogorensis TaxID=91915 RepID=A0A060QM01_9PROT|nr:MULTISPECIES: NAD-dependent epimerase/dehydratase family protein [Asaia]ETC98349.1 NAD-dependent epimerase [Asaia sp. SF2.1]MDL2170939.1 NAD-dependent epimerase/dehydratase family protein [Asaia sp. HumB]CDG40807.1 UDP-N-acetylglucosamine 4-epimerase [Asaia bogorensis]